MRAGSIEAADAYDRWLDREAEAYWADAPTCACGGELDDESDCLECGEHSMTDYEKRTERAEYLADQED